MDNSKLIAAIQSNHLYMYRETKDDGPFVIYKIHLCDSRGVIATIKEVDEEMADRMIDILLESGWPLEPVKKEGQL